MRLTILINGSDPTVNHDYAVLWLDTDEHRWSREAHEGIDLPPWGGVVIYRISHTVLVKHFFLAADGCCNARRSQQVEAKGESA